MLSRHILTTIVYYDVLDYPLTAFEIWKHLITLKGDISSNSREENETDFSLSQVIVELEKNFRIQKHIEEFRGFYFLKGRKDLVATRIKRQKVSEEKYKRALQVIKWLRFLPFVRMIAVVGRVAMKNSEKNSDIDLLVVVEKGHLYTGRFLITVFLQLIGKRRHGNKIKNRICLNHFLSTELNLSIRDLFSTHEYSFMLLIFGRNVLLNFYRENSWIQEYRPNWKSGVSGLKEIPDNFFSKKIRTFFENILKHLSIEGILKRWQIRKIEKNPQTKKNGSVIVYSESELAFWPNFRNQGPKIFERFKKRLQSLD